MAKGIQSQTLGLALKADRLFILFASASRDTADFAFNKHAPYIFEPIFWYMRIF